MKHALFAERLAPTIAADESTLATNLNDLPVDSRLQYAKAKREAEPRLKHNRALLFPEDDDG